MVAPRRAGRLLAITALLLVFQILLGFELSARGLGLLGLHIGLGFLILALIGLSAGLLRPGGARRIVLATLAVLIIQVLLGFDMVFNPAGGEVRSVVHQLVAFIILAATLASLLAVRRASPTD
jgi:hypothetical protein